MYISAQQIYKFAIESYKSNGVDLQKLWIDDV